MPTPMAPAALAGAGAMDQVPMLRAAAARTSIHRRECSEIFLKLPEPTEAEPLAGSADQSTTTSYYPYPPPPRY